MKKFFSLVLTLALCVCVLGYSANAEEAIPVKVGVLSLLNQTEEQYTQVANILYKTAMIMMAEGDDASPFTVSEITSKAFEPTVIFYDSLDVMLMALQAGDIQFMLTYDGVADYLTAQNDELVKTIGVKDDQGANGDMWALLRVAAYSNSFSFLLREGEEALRDEMNGAIQAMQDDGTLQRLIDEQITAVNQAAEIVPVALPVLDGAPTLRVAVTGALPPMDYVAADGTPAGFNTAVLSEIGSRIGRNIEIVVVDSLGRLTALSSGNVDAVFWTRGKDGMDSLSAFTGGMTVDYFLEKYPDMSEERKELMIAIFTLREQVGAFKLADVPENTITTASYYSDTMAVVMPRDGISLS